MTLDEAILHAEEVAEGHEKIKCIKAVTLEECKCADEHRQLAEWLKELKQLREQIRWIPISEKLPEKSGDYWCTFGGTSLTGSDYYTTESDAKKIFDNPEEYAGWGSQNVIAWMPLPKPYRESKDN